MQSSMKKLPNSLFFAGVCIPISCSYLVGDVPILEQILQRHYTLSLNDILVSTLFLVLVPRNPPAFASISSVNPSSSDYEAVTLTPARSCPSCSRHIFVTHFPIICTISLQSSKIGRVAIYCVTVFCLFGTYASVSSTPPSCIAVFRVGYSHIL